MTGRNLPSADPYYGHALKDRPILAIDRVRFVGEPVVAVAAESPPSPTRRSPSSTSSTRASRRSPSTRHWRRMPRISTTPSTCGRVSFTAWVKSTSSPAMSVTTTRSPVATSRRCSPRGNRRRRRVHLPGGLPVLAGAAHHHCPVDGRRRLTVWSSCQHPFLVRAELADLFGLPVAAVRVVVPYLGGGFGSKSYTKMEPITSALARRPAARCASPTASTSRWSPPAATG